MTPPPKDSQEVGELRDIVFRVAIYGARAKAKSAIDPQSAIERIEQYIATREAALLERVRTEVVGPNLPVKEIEGRSMAHNEVAHTNEVQNELREQQRTALQEIEGSLHA